MEDVLYLKWNNYSLSFLKTLRDFHKKEKLCDTTLACHGVYFPAHRLVLSICSEYFEEIFERTACKHPFLIINDIEPEQLETVLKFIYQGDVKVPHNKFSQFIRAVEALKIKGLISDSSSLSKNSANLDQLSQTVISESLGTKTLVETRYSSIIAQRENVNLESSKPIFKQSCDTELPHQEQGSKIMIHEQNDYRSKKTPPIIVDPVLSVEKLNFAPSDVNNINVSFASKAVLDCSYQNVAEGRTLSDGRKENWKPQGRGRRLLTKKPVRKTIKSVRKTHFDNGRTGIFETKKNVLRKSLRNRNMKSSKRYCCGKKTFNVKHGLKKPIGNEMSGLTAAEYLVSSSEDSGKRPMTVVNIEALQNILSANSKGIEDRPVSNNEDSEDCHMIKSEESDDHLVITSEDSEEDCQIINSEDSEDKFEDEFVNNNEYGNNFRTNDEDLQDKHSAVNEEVKEQEADAMIEDLKNKYSEDIAEGKTISVKCDPVDLNNLQEKNKAHNVIGNNKELMHTDEAENLASSQLNSTAPPNLNYTDVPFDDPSITETYKKHSKMFRKPSLVAVPTSGDDDKLDSYRSMVKCSFCSFTTTQPYIKVHEDAHTCKTSYKCKYCWYTSSVKHDIENHECQTHSDKGCKLDQQKEQAFAPLSTEVESENTNTGGETEIITENATSSNYELQSIAIKCKLCSAISSSSEELAKHCHLMHNEKTFQCKLCSFIAFQESDMKSHEMNHSDTKNKADEIKATKALGEGSITDTRRKYSKSFSESGTSDGTFHARSKQDQNSNRVKCRFCPYTASTITLINSHEYAHSCNISYKCKYCWYRSIIEQNVENHERQSHAEEKLKTDQPIWLTGEVHPQLPVEADSAGTCGNESKILTEKKSNLYHKIKTRLFKCKLCPDFNSSSEELAKQHQKMHNEKALKCKSCSYVGFLDSDLKSHEMIHDNDEMEFVSSDLKSHEIIHSNDKMEFVMSDSGKKLENESESKLTCELQTRLFKCKLCPDFNSSSEELAKQHQIMHNEKALKCKSCSFIALLESDMKSHEMIHESSEIESLTTDSDKKSGIESESKLSSNCELQIRLFKCKLCPEFSTSSEELAKQHQIMHNDKTLKWKSCSFIAFIDSDTKSQEMIDSTSEMEAESTDSVKKSEILSENKKEAHGVHTRLFKCKLCPDFNSSSEELAKQHQVMHNEKSLKCKYCSFIAFTESDMKNHEVLHSASNMESGGADDDKASENKTSPNSEVQRKSLEHKQFTDVSDNSEECAEEHVGMKSEKALECKSCSYIACQESDMKSREVIHQVTETDTVNTDESRKAGIVSEINASSNLELESCKDNLCPDFSSSSSKAEENAKQNQTSHSADTLKCESPSFIAFLDTVIKSHEMIHSVAETKAAGTDPGKDLGILEGTESSPTFEMRTKIFKCKLCPDFNSTREEFAKEHRMMHNENARKCKYCSLIAFTDSDMKNHEMTHSTSEMEPEGAASGKKSEIISENESESSREKQARLFKCKLCPDFSSSNEKLAKEHQIMHDEEASQSCSFLGFSEADIQHHKLLHGSPKKESSDSYKMSEVKNFDMSHSSAADMESGGTKSGKKSEIVTRDKNNSNYDSSSRLFKPNLCPDLSSNNEECSNQLSEKPLQCKSCSFTSVQELEMKSHEMIHSGTEPDTLQNKAEKSLGEVSSSEIHDKDTKSFSKGEYSDAVLSTDKQNADTMKCRFCPFITTAQVYLRTHEVAHSCKTSYKCKYCWYRSIIEQNVENHEAQSHTEEISKAKMHRRQKGKLHPSASVKAGSKRTSCSSGHSGAVAKDETGIKSELQARLFKCKLCPDFSCSNEELAKQHQIIHNGKALKCKSCSFLTFQESDMKSHETIHQDTKRRVCQTAADKSYEELLDADIVARCVENFKELENSSDKGILAETKHILNSPIKKCIYCPYTNRGARHIKKHEDAHVAEISYKCKYCWFRSVKSVDVHKHEKKCHVPEAETGRQVSHRQSPRKHPSPKVNEIQVGGEDAKTSKSLKRLSKESAAGEMEGNDRPLKVLKKNDPTKQCTTPWFFKCQSCSFTTNLPDDLMMHQKMHREKGLQVDSDSGPSVKPDTNLQLSKLKR